MMLSLSVEVERRMKRWQEQRWILDAIIKTVGIEWDQYRIGYTLGPCGPQATADFNGVRSRVQKFNDISREFKRAAMRREGMAKHFMDEGHSVATRESSFIAALLYGSAQWLLKNYCCTRESVMGLTPPLQVLLARTRRRIWLTGLLIG
ncbi:MAG: hypothetical protein ACYDER_06255 [Ktedonobacteraceae bacterium]